MALNDLLNGIKRAAVGGALGLALLVPVGYGCGDDVENNYYGDGDDRSGTPNSYTCNQGCLMIEDLCQPQDSGMDVGSCMDECEGDQKDGYGVPNKFFDCAFNACKDDLGDPDSAIEQCWAVYKHQG